MMAIFIRIAVVTALAWTTAACTTLGTNGLVASASLVELTPAAASAIAGDMVNRLSEHVGPGTGTIVLKKDDSPFGQALEAALRSGGYAVATDQVEGGKAVPLAYVIDSIDSTVLARLSTQQVDLGRAYSITASGARPTSPLSIMRRT